MGFLPDDIQNWQMKLRITLFQIYVLDSVFDWPDVQNLLSPKPQIHRQLFMYIYYRNSKHLASETSGTFIMYRNCYSDQERLS